MNTLTTQVSAIEKRLSAIETGGVTTRDTPTVRTDPCRMLFDQLEARRKKQIDKIISEYGDGKPEPIEENFFDIVKHAIAFVRRNEKALQDLFGATGGAIIDFVHEFVVILVTTDFVGNPVLGSIQFIQRTILLIIESIDANKHIRALITEPAPTVAMMTPAPPTKTKKRDSLIRRMMRTSRTMS